MLHRARKHELQLETAHTPTLQYDVQHWQYVSLMSVTIVRFILLRKTD